MSDQAVDSLTRGSFWHKDSLITHVPYELQPILIFSPVANFRHHPLVHDRIKLCLIKC